MTNGYMDSLKKNVNKYLILKLLFYPFIKLRRFFFKKREMRDRMILNRIGDVMFKDPVIKVNEFEGVFNIDINSDLFYRYVMEGMYEPELAKLCLKYLDKEKDVIDIGANIGFYTVLFAKNLNKGKVLSIEPTSRALDRLYRNVKLNDVEDKIHIFKGAVSNEIAEIEIKTIVGKEEYSSIGNLEHPSIINEEWITETIDTVTLDDLTNKKQIKPGFIKMDVEGAEYLVLDGSKRVLSKNRPIILSELSDFLLRKNGSSAEEIVNVIKSYDYNVHDPINTSKLPSEEKFGNIICFPKELEINFPE